MDQAYTFLPGNDECSPAARLFSETERWLQSEDVKQKEHGEIEALLMKEGMEILRLLFQGYLDGRAAREVKEEEVVGADGVSRPRGRRHCERHLETLPIATGIIEGACRHLINRMDLTGARWGLERAEAILKLRSLRSSGDLQEYWTFHLQEELKRNHESRYERSPWPLAA